MEPQRAQNQILVVEIADILAQRHGFEDLSDVRPLELMKMLVDDAEAIVTHIEASE